MAYYAYFSPTTHTASDFSSTSNLPKSYDLDGGSYANIKTKGNGTSTLYLGGLTQFTQSEYTASATDTYAPLKIPSTGTYQYMPENAVITGITAWCFPFSWAIKEPTFTVNIIENGSIVSSKSITVTGDVQISTALSYDTMLKHDINWLKNSIVFSLVQKGNYSLSTSTINTDLNECYVIVEYVLFHTLTVNATAGGTVTGGGTYESGKTVTLTATPNKGYRFVKWSDGNTNATRTVTVTANATYTAEFTKNVYVTYDSIFSFAKWKDTGITAGNGAVSDITNIGFALTSNAGVSEATCSSHYFPVEYGKSYKIDIDIVGTNWDVYIFFCDKDGNWIDFADSSNRFSSNGGGVSSRVFTAPNKSSVVKAQIRVDANGSNNKVLFSNFRIYPAEYEYFSNTVSAEERDDVNAWSQPRATRQGYQFVSWVVSPDGGNQYYPPPSSFPTEDMTLYSYWDSTQPEILSVQILYNGSQVSLSNKIIAGQGYIIGVTIK